MEQFFAGETDRHFGPPSPCYGTEIETIGSRTPTAEDDVEMRAEENDVELQEVKRRAPVWKHYSFSKFKGKDGKLKPRATCIYCKNAKYIAISKYGTSNAKNHIGKCAVYKEFAAANPILASPFDQKTYCKLFAEAIMCHAYSLNTVEHVKLRTLHSYLNPQVVHMTRNTILRYCLLEHAKLKIQLYESLSNVNSRICFTSDGWSSKVTSRGYLTLTAHYIDDNWKLKSHILNFKYFPPPHKGHDIYVFVLGLIKEWKLEGKTFSMTCDNAGSMDVMVSRLKTDLHVAGKLPCDGRFFHVRCSAHILNLIVQSGLKVVDECVIKLRKACNFIEGSDNRITRFEGCVVESRSNFKGRLMLDCPTRWNSTFLMIKKAYEAREVFDLFAVREGDTFAFSLSLEEWEKVRYVCDFLEPFYEITCLFSGLDYPTANLYFVNIAAIETLLAEGHQSPIESIRAMSIEMMMKFEKYWSDYSIILSIAVCLDPRFKLKFVQSILENLYVDEEVAVKVKAVRDAFVDLFKFYNNTCPTASPSNSRSSSASSSVSLARMFKRFEASNSSGGDAEVGVDAYLNAPLVPNEPGFDVLKFWQSPGSIYPSLARMAKDVLAIPITSVASESSFSMGSRTLTKYRSNLLPKNFEAFVTTQNWLFGYMKEEEVAECYEVVKDSIPEDIDFDSLPTD